MKKKIINIVLIITILMSITNISKASLKEGDTPINSTWYGSIAYSYNGEERKAIQRGAMDQPVYITKKDNTGNYFYPSDIQVYNNELIRKILKNGYGCRKENEIGNFNSVEAFLATQEAIYIALEDRNIEDYVVYEDYGQYILNGAKKILDDAKAEKDKTINIVEKNEYWKEYEKNTEYKYKEFSVVEDDLSLKNIEVKEGIDTKITDEAGNVKQTFSNEDTFYLVVPKNLDQNIKLKISFEGEDILAYSCKNPEEENNLYLFAEEGIRTIEKEFDIDVTGNSKVEITNIDNETKAPVQGNTFSIIKENSSTVKENLITNEAGKINVTLDKGKYYLKQNLSVEGYDTQKALIEIQVNDKENIKIKVESSKNTEAETTNIEKETNVVEKNEHIVENNITEVSNITNSNINKEIINQTNETNLNNVNHFINTINRKNVVNLKKENTYNNEIDEEAVVQNKLLDGENKTLRLTRQDYINYIDMIMQNTLKAPILPVASK